MSNNTSMKTQLKTGCGIAVMFLGLMLNNGEAAGVSVSEENDLDMKILRVKNDFFEFKLAPEKGAQVYSFKTKYGDKDWCWKGSSGILDSGHFFMDNFLGEGSPGGELCFIKHQYEIVKSGPAEVEIRCWTTTRQKLELEKRFIIPANAPYIRVGLKLTNHGTNVLVKGLWPKYDLQVSGEKANNRYYRPYPSGILVTGWEEANQRNTQGEEFLKLPCGGWTTVLNDKTQEGIVSLLDYNWLRTLYNCHPCWTVEWFYEDVPLPPEKAWSTGYDMVLVKGFPNMAHASTNMIMSVAMEAGAADEARITFIVSRSLSGDLKDVRLQGQVREVDGAGIHPLKELDVGNVGWDPKQASQTFKVNNDIRLVAEMTLTATRAGGAPLEEKFIYYWPGKSGEKFDLVAGGITPTYKRAPAKKIKQYPKPERVTLVPHAKPVYLECRGIGYSLMQVREAAKRAGIEDVKAGSFQNTFAGSNLSYVPTSYEEMLAYDLVVLNNVTAESMTDFGLELLKDYVNAGGGLLVIGGWFAFDPGGYAGTQLEEILPVKLFGSPFSWERLVPPVPLTITPEAKCLADARWAGTPLCYWRQKLTPREGSWVEIKAGDNPFLVCGAYGKGRVAAIATHALGNPASGETPFWEDGAWVDNLSKVVKWLAFGAKK